MTADTLAVGPGEAERGAAEPKEPASVDKPLTDEVSAGDGDPSAMRAQHPGEAPDAVAGPAPPDAAPADEKIGGTPWRAAAARESPSRPETAPIAPAPEPPIAALPPESAAPPRRARGVGSVLAASLLGGVVGAGLALAAERYWLRPVAGVETRVARLEQRAAAPAAPVADVAGLERRLAALEAGETATAERLRAAESRAEASAQRIEQALRRPDASPAASPAEAAQGASGAGAVIEQVNLRIAAIEEQLRARAETEAQAAQRVESRLAEQAQQVAPLAAQLTETAQRLTAFGTQVAEQGRRLEAVVAQGSERDQKLAALGQQLAEQNRHLGAVSRQVAQGGPERAAALRVVAAEQVANALRDGAPYEDALAALRRLDIAPDRLAALEPFAASGAPTAPALAREFAPVRERIVAAMREPANDWTDWIERMAAGVVTVRPVGRPASGTSSDTLGRLDDALARGALKDASAAWDALPEPARRASAEWGSKLKARSAAGEAARALSGQVLSAVSAPAR